MSIRIQSPAFYSRGTNLPTRAAFTVSGWARYAAAEGVFNTIACLENASGNDGTYIAIDSGDGLVVFHEGDTQTPFPDGGDYDGGAWFFFALVGDGTNVRAYARLEGETSLSSLTGISQGAYTAAGLTFFSDAFDEYFDGYGRYFRVWSAALSEAELLAESASATPVRTSNINADYRMGSTTDDNEDASGNGFNMTVNGTPANNASEPSITIGGGGTPPRFNPLTLAA